MLILHAAWSSHDLLLWGETSEPKKGRKRSGALPHDAGFAALSTALAPLGINLSRQHSTEAVAWLPTAESGPLKSPLLLETAAPPESDTYLAPWLVAAARLPDGLDEDFFALCAAAIAPGQNTLAPGLVLGPDVLFWFEAMRHAWSVVARQQFLPGLVRAEAGYEARWRPVLSAAEARLLKDLAAKMPPSARALNFDIEVPPDTPAAHVLAGFLESTVDGLARRGTNGFLRPQGIHDAWLAALQGDDRTVRADAAKLAALETQIRDWQRPVTAQAEAPYRLCLRLHEPPPDASAWQVEYLMQSREDPSLLIAAADVWKAGGKPLSSRAAASREHLLASLGQVAGISPAIEQSLKQRQPEGFDLDLNGAHQFLTATAPALEQSGFGVLLPAWWTGRGPAQRLTARAHAKSPKMTGGSGLSLDAIVEFQWRIALGENEITLKELEELARLKTPLVRIRGQWVEMAASEIASAVEFLKKRYSTTGTVADAIRMSVGAGGAAGALEISGVTAEGPVGDLLATLSGRRSFAELAPPARLDATLRHYQQRGYSWLDFLTSAGLGACLADDMGLGKTIQTLAFLQRRVNQGAERPALLVCPTSVIGNWQREAARFTPTLQVMVHHGATRQKGGAFEKDAGRQNIVLCSYALLHRDFELLKTVAWDGVVLDEAQNIKNSETKQARAARGLPAGFRIALTGTPVENNVGDLWSLFEFVNPGFLGSQADFKRRFFVPIQMRRDSTAAARLQRVTGPFILRRLKTDKSIIADLPDKLEMNVFCNLTKEQASLYAAVVKDAERAIEDSEGIARKGIVLATLAKLKQVCNHPAQFLKDPASTLAGRSGKLARLTEMLEEVLSVGDRALVFTQFAEMGEMLKRHLQESFGREVLFLHGGVTKKQRDHMVELFGRPAAPPIFLLSLKAGGTGLNLTTANHVFHFDRWWNPAVENQATDRAFRIGQTRNVQVHKYVCAGTLEEKIDAMIENKKGIAGQVVGAGEGWLTELSNAELKKLFELRSDAIGE